MTKTKQTINTLAARDEYLKQMHPALLQVPATLQENPVNSFKDLVEMAAQEHARRQTIQDLAAWLYKAPRELNFDAYLYIEQSGPALFKEVENRISNNFYSFYEHLTKAYELYALSQIKRNLAAALEYMAYEYFVFMEAYEITYEQKWALDDYLAAFNDDHIDAYFQKLDQIIRMKEGAA